MLRNQVIWVSKVPFATYLCLLYDYTWFRYFEAFTTLPHEKFSSRLRATSRLMRDVSIVLHHQDAGVRGGGLLILSFSGS